LTMRGVTRTIGGRRMPIGAAAAASRRGVTATATVIAVFRRRPCAAHEMVRVTLCVTVHHRRRRHPRFVVRIGTMPAIRVAMSPCVLALLASTGRDSRRAARAAAARVALEWRHLHRDPTHGAARAVVVAVAVAAAGAVDSKTTDDHPRRATEDEARHEARLGYASCSRCTRVSVRRAWCVRSRTSGD
jgi:hypothetical protein